MQTLWIPFRLPGLNEIIAEARKHKMASAKQKEYYTSMVKLLATKMKPIKGRAHYRFTWYEKSRRRNPDNIAGGGEKYILDGLQDAGIIENDGWGQVASLHHDFQLGPIEGVKVEIWPI